MTPMTPMTLYSAKLSLVYDCAYHQDCSSIYILASSQNLSEVQEILDALVEKPLEDVGIYGIRSTIEDVELSSLTRLDGNLMIHKKVFKVGKRD